MVHPGALVVAVESGNLAKVKEVGNAMQHEGWTINWIKHAEEADKTDKLSIRNYLVRKASENALSKSTLKRGGGSKRKGAKRQRSRRRYTVRR